MKARKAQTARKNTRTGYFLRGDEVFCPHCGRNFGDIFLLDKHRVKSSFGEINCVDPQSLNMTAHVNFDEAIIWKVSKW